jgi:hypothetical protein
LLAQSITHTVTRGEDLTDNPPTSLPPGAPLRPGQDCVFLKQYGARRSGTNVLRELLHRNFTNVVVLMHVLGDKHEPPVDLASAWDDSRSQPDPAWAFVTRATWLVPAAFTSTTNEAQRDHLRSLAEPLAAAFASGRVGYLISVKDPYPWALGMASWNGWLPPRYSWLPRILRRPGWRDKVDLMARDACLEFNRNYREWLALLERFPERATLVHAEDLAEKPAAVLDALAVRHGLARRTGSLDVPRGSILSTDWDDRPTVESPVGFRKRQAWIHKQTAAAASVLQAAVTETIDWTLAARMGYESRES